MVFAQTLFLYVVKSLSNISPQTQTKDWLSNLLSLQSFKIVNNSCDQLLRLQATQQSIPHTSQTTKTSPVNYSD